MCVVVRENYWGKGKLYVPLLGGLSRVSQDTRTRHRHCHRALVRHGSHLSRNRLNLEPWFCYWLASALSSLTCLVLKIGAILEGRDTISSERAEDSLTAGVLRDASRAWQCTSMIPPFGRLKQEGCLGSTIKTKLNRKAGTAEAQFCQRFPTLVSLGAQGLRSRRPFCSAMAMGCRGAWDAQAKRRSAVSVVQTPMLFM